LSKGFQKRVAGTTSCMDGCVWRRSVLLLLLLLLLDC